MTSSGNVVELGATYLAIDLYEDIFSSSMSGTVTFIDTNNIRVTFPTTTSGFATVTFGQVNLSAIPEDIIPDGNNTRALGSSTKRWTTLHSAALNTGDIVMKNDNGHFTIDEQNEYLRVYNHRNGKYYKLVMQEI